MLTYCLSRQSPTSQPHQSQWQQKQQGKKQRLARKLLKNVQVRAIVVYFVKKKKKRQEKLSVTTLKKTNKNMQMLVQHCAGCTQQLHCFSSQERDRWCLLYDHAVSSLTHHLYPAVSCRHPLNNSQHGFRNAFHAARIDTTPGFCGLGARFCGRFWHLGGV